MLLKFAESSHPIFRGTSASERGKLRSNGGGKTSIQFIGRTQNIEWLTELPVGQRAPRKPAASGQLGKQEILTQPPLAELQANEERQGNPLQEYEQRFEKLSEDQKLSRLRSEAGWRLVEIGHFFFALPSPRGKENQSLCREYTLPRDQKGTRIKGWIQSNVRFGPVSDIKVCNTYGRYSIEVQVQSLFKDQTESWIRVVNGIDRFVREAMPIQESNNPYSFQVSKFIARLLRQSQKVNREADGVVHYDQVIDECKKKQSDNTEYWSDEMKKDFVNAPGNVSHHPRKCCRRNRHH